MKELDVDAMLAKLPCDKFDEWCAFYSIEPWGGHRDDWRFGMLVAWIVKAFTGKDVKPEDVFATLREEKELTPEQLARQLEMRAMLMGAQPTIAKR